MKKLDLMAEINDRIAVCQRCPSLCKSRTNVVPGVGSMLAKLFLVGEGPGKDEDASGLPFVGQAGMLLENVLNTLGWRREEVFISNAVKCRPPMNRTPMEEEVENCAAFLRLQLKVIQPKVVVLMGGTALKAFVSGNPSVTALRGSWLVLDEPIKAEYFVTYHPAYILRNLSEKEAWVNDWWELRLKCEKEGWVNA